MKNCLAPNAHSYTTEKYWDKDAKDQVSPRKQEGTIDLGKVVFWKSEDWKQEGFPGLMSWKL